MFVIEKNSFGRAKVVVFGQRWLNSGKVVVFWLSWLYSGKSGFIRAK